MSGLLANPVALVEQVVLLSVDRGDGIGQTSLLRRLQDLSGPPVPAKEEQAAITIEHEILSSFLSSGLEPSVAAAVLVRLDERRRAAGLAQADDPWLHAHPARFRQRRGRIAEEIEPEVARAFGLCRRYERTRKVAYLAEAVKSLESAANHEKAALSPNLSPANRDVEADCLSGALSDVLSPFAYRFFVEYATARMEEESLASGRRPTPVRPGAGKGQWLSPDVASGSGDADEADDAAWFVGAMDEQYRREVIDANRRREDKALSQAKCAREMADRMVREEKRLREEREKQARGERERRQRELRSEREKAAVARAKAEREVRAAERLNQELLAGRERESAQRQREWQEWEEAKRQREEKDAEARRQEEEVEASRVAWEQKRRAKESPPRLQRAGVRVEWRNG